jgi:hypothetical protein
VIARAWRAWRAAPFLTLAFAGALVLTIWFAGRFVAQAVYWSDPAHLDQPIAGWMTPGYVARSWDVPPEVVAPALSLPPPGQGDRRPPPLQALARERGVPLNDLIAALEAVIAAHRQAGEADQ